MAKPVVYGVTGFVAGMLAADVFGNVVSGITAMMIQEEHRARQNIASLQKQEEGKVAAIYMIQVNKAPQKNSSLQKRAERNVDDTILELLQTKDVMLTAETRNELLLQLFRDDSSLHKEMEATAKGIDPV